jgi:hypothetical protein
MVAPGSPNRSTVVITKRMTIGTLALFATAALSAAQPAQAPTQDPAAPPRQTQPPTQKPSTPSAPQTPAATTAAQPTATLVGCLYRERQVPGRTPNVVERAGVLEDYILADATMPAPPRPGTPSGAVGTSGTVPSTGNMYKVENIPDDRLKALVGKRVEVSGRIDPENAGLGGASTRDRGPGRDDVNLPEFEAASIREVSGTCPAVPAPRK